MKTHTLILLGTMIVLGVTAFKVHKSEPVVTAHTITQSPVWFNTIQIAEGITVEFEYGEQLQVFVEGDKNLVKQLALVLEDNVLTATGKSSKAVPENVTIKVVTPVSISLATQPNSRQHTHTISNEKSISQVSRKQLNVKPVLMQQNVFKVCSSNNC